jgi:hypothetical protein
MFCQAKETMQKNYNQVIFSSFLIFFMTSHANENPPDKAPHELLDGSEEVHLKIFNLITKSLTPLDEIDSKIDASFRYEDLVDQLKSK